MTIKINNPKVSNSTDGIVIHKQAAVQATGGVFKNLSGDGVRTTGDGDQSFNGLEMEGIHGAAYRIVETASNEFKSLLDSASSEELEILRSQLLAATQSKNPSATFSASKFLPWIERSIALGGNLASMASYIATFTGHH